MAKRFVEAVLEIPDPDVVLVTVPGTPPVRHPGQMPSGVAALLWNADKAEDASWGGRTVRPELRTASTDLGDVDAVLDGLPGGVRQDSAGEPLVPAVLDDLGDVVMILGLGTDALTVARSMAAGAKDAIVKTAGSFRTDGCEHLVSRNELTAARAAAVIAGQTVFIAFGLDADGAVRALALMEMDADQVWLAVDATRKPADTMKWVRRVGWASRTDALAVLSSQNTLTPQSVNDLGLHIGWLDDRKATHPVL